MNLVLDANILFAALIKNNLTRQLLVSENIQLFAPEFIFNEVQKYLKVILKKSKKSIEELERLMFELSQIIVFIPTNDLHPYLTYAKQISPDPDDALYLALALTLQCPIWSNDKRLKEQKEVIVYSTEDLLRTLARF
jgi:predicted nucleic acid-binding protein